MRNEGTSCNDRPTVKYTGEGACLVLWNQRIVLGVGSGKGAAPGRNDRHSPDDRGTCSWAEGSRGASWVCGADEGGDDIGPSCHVHWAAAHDRGLWVSGLKFHGLADCPVNLLKMLGWAQESSFSASSWRT